MVHLSSITEPKDTQADNRAAHGDDQVLSTTTVYGSKFAAMELPKHVMPAEEMPPRVAYKLIADELALDGNPFLNLASFVTTYMEPEVEKLMTDAFNKNFIDYEEYPATCDLQNRCVSMIGHLFNVPVNNKGEEPLGVSTVGSSEAIIMRNYLVGKGIPLPHIVVDELGYNTAATAKNCAEIMRLNNFKSIIIVTQYFHVSRTRMALKSYNVHSIHSAHAYYFEPRDIYSIVREAVAVPVYWMRNL